MEDTEFIKKLRDFLHEVRDKSFADALETHGFDSNGAALAAFSGGVNALRDKAKTCRLNKEETRERMISRLQEIEQSIFDAFIAFHTTKSKSAFEGVSLDKLDFVAEVLGEVSDAPHCPIDRDDFAAATLELIASVNAWDIDSYVKRTLVLELNSLLSIATSEKLYSDNDLRRRVKAIVADFAYQFAEHDKDFMSKFEKMRYYASRVFLSAPTAIGITSDGTTIAGLLPKP
ncbi:MAG: hypothetical protein AAF841_10435 [Pseudomonadota bacterium]